MAWLKESAYQKQIIIYLNNRAFGQAYDFSKEYLNAYPDDMAAHFLAAKSCLKSEKFEEAATEARKAFNLAKDEGDMIMCAIHGAVAYYRLGQYQKGYDLLKATKGLKKIKTYYYFITKILLFYNPQMRTLFYLSQSLL